MGVQMQRIRADIEAISGFTQTPGGGATRPTFSPQWKAARDYVIAQAAGCSVRIDAAGNVHARPAGLGWDQPAWLCGSHIDSVPCGGDFDGVAGVVVALELIRSAADEGVAGAAVELVIFAEEEGTTFGLGMIGSRAWAGELCARQLGELRNAAGQTYLQAGASLGVDPDRLPREQLEAGRYLGFIEVHIEQGPGMWRRGDRLAVVSAIAGRKQYRVVVSGEANHAGATSMRDRRDALAAAAEMITALEQIVTGEAVITVGRLINHPNAVNVIPDRVEFTVDLRAGDDAVIEQCDEALRARAAEICRRRMTTVEIDLTESIAASPMDKPLCRRLLRACGPDGPPMTVSGALHDAAVIARFMPTAMLFVPSRGGISHNPAEFSRVEDIAAAAQVVERVVRRPTLRQLNAASRQDFVAVCGRFFEQSPWIAERAWALRPFASLCDLHKKLCGLVGDSSNEEKVALIQAHPDLVGRLAREGRLTRESNHEQAAAGLAELSADEIAAFERYNGQYREKFGFPFVICARQNRKETILSEFPRRLQNSRPAEIAAALDEIYKIARFRLIDAAWED
jgi:allantoate deiminase